MKKILFVLALLGCFNSYSQQTDYSLAKTGEYVLGVYLFINCTPANEYDYVGKVDKFDVFKSDEKSIEKIIKKAKKKNAHFDGMIFKRDFKHVELIKFRESAIAVSGFRVGDKVTFKRAGKVTKGTVIMLDDAKLKAVIEFIDENGEEQASKIKIKELTHN